MEGVDRGGGKWKVIKERLGFVGLACCGGPVWGSSNMRVREEEEEEEEEMQQEQEAMMNPGESLNGSGQEPDPDCVGQTPSSGMNLATALAAERQVRTDDDGWEGGLLVGPNSVNSIGLGTPGRVSLLRLLEEGDGAAEEDEKRNDMLCCVCMGRKKGAAFIPCGHTFCRVCSREIWLNRGTCPLCNRSITEILDIF